MTIARKALIARKSPAAKLGALALILCAAACGAGGSAETEPVTLFAAASLTDAFTAIAAAYEAETGEPVRLAFAASSTLAQQIKAGAPADIYAAASTAWMDELAANALIEPGSLRTPIGNALVVIAAPSQGAAPPSDGVVAPPRPDERIAVGDPDHVPAGVYARQALESLGLWEAFEPRLARASDVRGALTLVATGEAARGIVYATDAAITPGVAVLQTLPAESHDPIVYPMAIVAGEARPAVERFFAYATGEPGLAVFERHGFTRR